MSLRKHLALTNDCREDEDTDQITDDREDVSAKEKHGLFRVPEVRVLHFVFMSAIPVGILSG